MKTCAHACIFTDHWSDAALPLFDTARELGLDALEIPVGDDVVFDVAAARRRAVKVGLKLVISPGGEWPARYDLSSLDFRERRAGLEWHRQQIDLAAKLGDFAVRRGLFHDVCPDGVAFVRQGVAFLRAGLAMQTV